MSPQLKPLWDVLARMPLEVRKEAKECELLELALDWTPLHTQVLDVLWRTSAYHCLTESGIARRLKVDSDQVQAIRKQWIALKLIHGGGDTVALTQKGLDLCVWFGKAAYAFPCEDPHQRLYGQAGVRLKGMTRQITGLPVQCEICWEHTSPYITVIGIQHRFFFCVACANFGVLGFSYLAEAADPWCVPHPVTGELIQGTT